MRSRINSIITQNRLVSRARSRARTQSTNIGKVLNNSSNKENNTSKAIKNQASQQNKELSKADAEAKNNFTNIQDAAQDLKGHTKKLLLMSGKDWGELTEAEISEFKEKAVSEATSMIEDYNQMVKSMAKEGGRVNELYLDQLSNYFRNAKTDLEAMGITQNKDGTLDVNYETLKTADAGKLRDVFCTTGGFADRVSKKTEDIISNAETNLAVLNRSQYAGNYSYNRYGSDIFDILNSGGKYNAKG